MKYKVFFLAIALMMAMTTSTVIAKGNHNNANTEMAKANKHASTEAMTKLSDGTYVVNTTTLAKDVKGFRGNTPLNIYIKGGKVVKIEPLANHETPNFFNKVKTGLLKKWYGMKASKAASAQVDGVTGATFSSKAVKENVKRGLKYYQAHK